MLPKCEICKRRWRHVIFVEVENPDLGGRKVVCQNCVSKLLENAELSIRDEQGDLLAALTPERTLFIQPRVVREPPISTAPEPVRTMAPLTPLPPVEPPQKRGRGRPRKEPVPA